jgi:hypothetical protein
LIVVHSLFSQIVHCFVTALTEQSSIWDSEKKVMKKNEKKFKKFNDKFKTNKNIYISQKKFKNWKITNKPNKNTYKEKIIHSEEWPKIQIYI